MYQLLSLIPELKVKSFEYDKFMSETVASIWKQITLNASSSNVLCEAYKTLAKFPMECHELKQLPAAVSYIFLCYTFVYFDKFKPLKKKFYSYYSLPLLRVLNYRLYQDASQSRNRKRLIKS